VTGVSAAELQVLLGTRGSASAKWAPPVRWLSGAIFVIFGIGKFTEHAHEVDSFENYGLPSPDAFVYLVGVLEILGGVLLIAGLLTRLVALALAGNMVGAIVVSGIGESETFPSLTLAPLLLIAMGFLLWVGPGEKALDQDLLKRGQR
jgi:putative oxidoreductase